MRSTNTTPNHNKSKPMDNSTGVTKGKVRTIRDPASKNIPRIIYKTQINTMTNPWEDQLPSHTVNIGLTL